MLKTMFKKKIIIIIHIDLELAQQIRLYSFNPKYYDNITHSKCVYLNETTKPF